MLKLASAFPAFLSGVYRTPYSLVKQSSVGDSFVEGFINGCIDRGLTDSQIAEVMYKAGQEDSRLTKSAALSAPEEKVLPGGGAYTPTLPDQPVRGNLSKKELRSLSKPQPNPFSTPAAARKTGLEQTEGGRDLTKTQFAPNPNVKLNESGINSGSGNNRYLLKTDGAKEEPPQTQVRQNSTQASSKTKPLMPKEEILPKPRQSEDRFDPNALGEALRQEAYQNERLGKSPASDSRYLQNQGRPQDLLQRIQTIPGVEKFNLPRPSPITPPRERNLPTGEQLDRYLPENSANKALAADRVPIRQPNYSPEFVGQNLYDTYGSLNDQIMPTVEKVRRENERKAKLDDIKNRATAVASTFVPGQRFEDSAFNLMNRNPESFGRIGKGIMQVENKLDDTFGQGTSSRVGDVLRAATVGAGTGAVGGGGVLSGPGAVAGGLGAGLYEALWAPRARQGARMIADAYGASPKWQNLAALGTDVLGAVAAGGGTNMARQGIGNLLNKVPTAAPLSTVKPNSTTVVAPANSPRPVVSSTGSPPASPAASTQIVGPPRTGAPPGTGSQVTQPAAAPSVTRPTTLTEARMGPTSMPGVNARPGADYLVNSPGPKFSTIGGSDEELAAAQRMLEKFKSTGNGNPGDLKTILERATGKDLAAPGPREMTGNTVVSTALPTMDRADGISRVIAPGVSTSRRIPSGQTSVNLQPRLPGRGDPVVASNVPPPAPAGTPTVTSEASIRPSADGQPVARSSRVIDTSAPAPTPTPSAPTPSAPTPSAPTPSAPTPSAPVPEPNVPGTKMTSRQLSELFGKAYAPEVPVTSPPVTPTVTPPVTPTAPSRISAGGLFRAAAGLGGAGLGLVGLGYPLVSEFPGVKGVADKVTSEAAKLLGNANPTPLFNYNQQHANAQDEGVVTQAKLEPNPTYDTIRNTVEKLKISPAEKDEILKNVDEAETYKMPASKVMDNFVDSHKATYGDSTGVDSVFNFLTGKKAPTGSNWATTFGASLGLPPVRPTDKIPDNMIGYGPAPQASTGALPPAGGPAVPSAVPPVNPAVPPPSEIAPSQMLGADDQPRPVVPQVQPAVNAPDAVRTMPGADTSGQETDPVKLQAMQKQREQEIAQSTANLNKAHLAVAEQYKKGQISAEVARQRMGTIAGAHRQLAADKAAAVLGKPKVSAKEVIEMINKGDFNNPIAKEMLQIASRDPKFQTDYKKMLEGGTDAATATKSAYSDFIGGLNSGPLGQFGSYLAFGGMAIGAIGLFSLLAGNMEMGLGLLGMGLGAAGIAGGLGQGGLGGTLGNLGTLLSGAKQQVTGPAYTNPALDVPSDPGEDWVNKSLNYARNKARPAAAYLKRKINHAVDPIKHFGEIRSDSRNAGELLSSGGPMPSTNMLSAGGRFAGGFNANIDHLIAKGVASGKLSPVKADQIRFLMMNNSEGEKITSNQGLQNLLSRLSQ